MFGQRATNGKPSIFCKGQRASEASTKRLKVLANAVPIEQETGFLVKFEQRSFNAVFFSLILFGDFSCSDTTNSGRGNFGYQFGSFTFFNNRVIRQVFDNLKSLPAFVFSISFCINSHSSVYVANA